MTTEELKAHRRAICEALIEGKAVQCCYTLGAEVLVWRDASASDAAQRVFSDRSTELVRIKPSPRKVWVGWPSNPNHVVPYVVENESGKCVYDAKVKWQLVEEEPQ